MEDKPTCPICGNPTRIYMGNARKDHLCGKHADELKAGKIEQCPDCNSWHSTDKTCKCKIKTVQTKETTNEFNLKKQPQIITVDSNNKSKCLTCGKNTDGLLFCGNCYHKYKDKELLFRIKKCSSVELLDESYEGIYTCKDGHIVKSKSERDIDNYLFDNKIPHAYEKEFPYGAEAKDVLRPDFYLPDYLGKDKHVYIEHWGYNENNRDYHKTKKFKLSIYQNKGITLICTYEKTDMNNVESSLDRKIKNRENIKENQINYPEE